MPTGCVVAALLLLLAVRSQAQLDVTLIGGQPLQPGRTPSQTHLIVTYDPLLQLEALPCVSTSTPSNKLPSARKTRGSYNPELSQGDIDALVSRICNADYVVAGETIANSMYAGGERAKSAMLALKQARQQADCDSKDTYALLEALKRYNQGAVPFADVAEFARAMVRTADAVGIQLCITANYSDPRSGRTLNETTFYTTGE